MPTFLRKLLIISLCLFFFQNTYAQLNCDFGVCSTCSESGCPPFQTQFVYKGTGTPTSYDWTINGLAITKYTNASPSVTFLTPGKYDVSLKVFDATSNSFKLKTLYITVLDTPKIDFTGTPLTGCEPLTVNFTNTTVAGGSGSNTYSWFTNGVPNNPTSATPPPIVYGAGNHTVILTVTNSFGCSKSKAKVAYVLAKAKPAAIFSANNTSFCAPPAVVTFYSGSTGAPPLTYNWYFQAPASTPTSTLASPAPVTYTGPSGTSYNVKLVVTDVNGCKDSVTTPNYINILKPKSLFNAPTGACVGTVVNFNNSASVPSNGTFSWNFGDPINGSASGSNPSYQFNDAGTWTVRLITESAGCKDTFTKQITIYPLPAVDFTINPTQPCPAPSLVQFIPNGTYASYTWDFADGTPKSNQASPSHTYTTNDTFSPTLTVISAQGCKSSINKPLFVTIYDLKLKMAVAPAAEGCVPRTFTFDVLNRSHVPTGAEGSYPYYPDQGRKWDFGIWGNSTQMNPSVTITTPGVYLIKVEVTTKNGCIAKDSMEVKTGTPPHASFTAAPTLICNKNYVTFTSTSTGTIDVYGWIFGDGGADAGQITTHKYVWPGKYTVTHFVAYHGCKDTFKVDTMITVLPSGAGWYPYFSCDTPNKVFFKDSSVGATTRTWDFGDGSPTSSATSPTHFFPAYNTPYVVRLITTNSTTGCIDTMTKSIICKNPSLSLTANDTAICAFDYVSFNAPMTGDTAGTYKWYVNNGLVEIDSYLTYTRQFINTGFYRIRVITTDSKGCYDTITKNNFIFVSKPTVNFSGAPLLGCVPLKVNFTETSTVPTGASIVSKMWDYGNGIGFVPGNTTSNTYTTAGQYTVKLVVMDNVGCADSLTIPGYVDAHKPKAAFSVPAHGCLKTAIAFTDASINASSYLWDFGDGSLKSTDANPTHAYSALGSYTVTLYVKDVYDCKDTFVLPNAVTIVKPTAAFTASDTISACPPPFIVTFTNTSTGAKSYYWDFDFATTTAGTPPPPITQAFLNPKYHNIMLVAIDQYGCTDTARGSINLLGYSGLITYDPLKGCVPLTVSLKSKLQGLIGASWDFSDGNVALVTSDTISHTFTTPGSYLPKLVITDNKNCKAASEGIDTIRVDASVANFWWSPACEFRELTVHDSSKAYFSIVNNWTWTFPDGSQKLTNPAKYKVGAVGTYPIKLFVKNSNGCVDSITKDITVNPWPTIDAGPDTTICLKDSAILMPNGGISYVWTPSYYLSCTACTNPLAGAQKKIKYIATGTDANGCENIDSVTVDIKTKVTTIASNDGEICDKDTLGLHVSGAKTYEWTPADNLDDSKSAHPVASPRNTLTYRVVGFEGSCIPDTHNVKVTVHPLPTVKASGEQTIVAGKTAEIHASGELIRKFMWWPGESLNCTECAAPTAKPSRTTAYVVKVYTDYGCVDSDHVTVTVLCDESQLFMPNTFTPNGDGQNDVFYPRGTGLDKVKSLRIYNRWGEMIYERQAFAINDANYGWDGTVKSIPATPDVFVYVVEAYCDNGEVMIIKGDVTLLR